MSQQPGDRGYATNYFPELCNQSPQRIAFLSEGIFNPMPRPSPVPIIVPAVYASNPLVLSPVEPVYDVEQQLVVSFCKGGVHACLVLLWPCQLSREHGGLA